jgi:hypothetical protein
MRRVTAWDLEGAFYWDKSRLSRDQGIGAASGRSGGKFHLTKLICVHIICAHLADWNPQ